MAYYQNQYAKSYQRRPLASASSAPRQITAKFASVCRECKGPIAVGEAILWAPGTPAVHVACPVVEAPVAPVAQPAMCPHCMVRPAGPRGHCGHRFCVEANDWARISASEVAKAERERRLGDEAEMAAEDEIERLAAVVNPGYLSVTSPHHPDHAAWVAAQAPVAPAPLRLSLDEVGIYVLPDGTVVKAQANREKTRVYAKRWVPSSQDRLMADGAHAHGEYVYEAGLVDVVARTGRKMTLEEAKAHSILYAQCVRCGRHLTDGKSVEQGMGPVCITYFS